MSDDLISRKAVLNILTEARVKDSILCSPAFVEMLTQRIKKIPTAFDKEKVIAEMNETKNIVEAKIKKSYVTRDEVSFYLNSGASDMAVEFIDIVKKGGIE